MEREKTTNSKNMTVDQEGKQHIDKLLGNSRCSDMGMKGAENGTILKQSDQNEQLHPCGKFEEGGLTSEIGKILDWENNFLCFCLLL